MRSKMQTTQNSQQNNSPNIQQKNQQNTQAMKKVHYLLTTQEAQKIKQLVAKEIKKFQERIIQLETENIQLKQQLGITEEYGSEEELSQPNPIVG